MNAHSSCLVKKLGHYIDLGDADKERLAGIEKSERSYAGGVDIHQVGDNNGELMVVKKGWLFNSAELPDGRRQIVRVHQPGDIIGFPDIAMSHATTTLTTIEDVVVCPFPKSALDKILRESPRLSALLLSIALRDQVILIDLLRAMGRMKAQERVSYMLLDLLARLRVTNDDMKDTFRLPMTQSQIADYLGLTNVYISKTLHQMEDANLVERRGTMIRLLDPRALAAQTDFDDRYAEMDTSWFPDQH